MALNAGQKFEGYAPIDSITLADVFIIIDKSDTTMSPDGTTKYCTAQQLSAFFEASNNAAVENSYLTISQMVSDQGNQTSGFIQFASDATSDPTVSNGYAYYEKLPGNNALLSDYRKLTPEEVAVIEFNYKTFQVREISSSEPSVPSLGQISFQTASTKVSHIRFDVNYSQFLLRNKTDLDAGFPISFYIDNITQKNRTIFKVVSFDTDASSYILKVEETENFSNFNLGDKVEVIFDYSDSHFVDISGYSVKKVSEYTSLSAWEVGDTFFGWATSSRYVVGRVVGLPFDLDDTDKVKLATDNTIF